MSNPTSVRESAPGAFASLAALRAACLDLPSADEASAAAVSARDAELTKPPGSLGRLEEIVTWLARWQRRSLPRLDRIDALVFAGNHGVARQGVSAFPIEVTVQMVANYASGGAAINQLATHVGANLRVVALDLDRPTEDFTEAPAMDEASFLAAVNAGYAAVTPEANLVLLGEMGIGNTTAAAALAAALFGGGGGARWAGRGTGVDDAGLGRKQAVIDRALARHSGALSDPLACAAAFGGRELAAMMGACLAARHRGVPVMLDGYVCTAAVAPLQKLRADALDHAMAGHVSAEPGHRRLLEQIGLRPLLDLGMRLGEGTGAAMAVSLVRAALACHAGMATFASAGVSVKGC